MIQVVADCAAVVGAGFLPYWIDTRGSFEQYAHGHFEIVYAVLIFIPILFVLDLYHPLRNFRSYRSILRLLVAAFAFGLILLVIDAMRALTGYPAYHSGGQLIVFVVLSLVMCHSARLGLSFLGKQVFVRNAIMIGNSEMSRLVLDCIAEQMKKGRRLGFRMLGHVADQPALGPQYNLLYLGQPAQLPEIRKAHNVSLMVYALDSFGNAAVNELIVHERLRGIPLISAVGLYEAITGRVPHRHVNATWLIEECLRSNHFSQVHMKKLIDRVLGFLLLCLSLPVVAVCGYLIKRESPGPILFTQQRIGQQGQPFTIYKLRTMRPVDQHDHATAEGWHHTQEARITSVGRFLRRTHLDELPQLINVVKGDMSLVGPRPEMEIFIKACEETIPFYRLRLDVKPGMTGWAQVAFRHTSTLEGYRDKFEYDLYYLSHLSLRFDLEILARTAFVLFLKTGRSQPCRPPAAFIAAGCRCYGRYG